MSRIEDMQAADKWFKALAAKKREMAVIEEYKQQEQERLSNWYEGESKPLLEAIESMENELASFYAKLREDNPKAKLSTPYGKVTSRTAAKWNWEDEDKILNHLKQSGFSNLVNVKTTESINKTELKKAFAVQGVTVIDTNGEPIEGVTVSEETTYKVEVV